MPSRHSGNPLDVTSDHADGDTGDTSGHRASRQRTGQPVRRRTHHCAVPEQERDRGHE